MQTVLNPAPNVVNLVITHHPIDWLEDGDEVNDRLINRAMFHLFGHKHKQQATLEARYVRIGAGAVNPSRGEKPYDPGYNLIDIQVAGAGAERQIVLKLHQRRLQADPELYVAIKSPLKTDVFTHSIDFPDAASLPSIGGATLGVETSKAEPAVSTESTVISEDDAEAAMGEKANRELLYRFWKLKSSNRRDIAKRLKLLEDGEMTLPEPERYGRALIRAGQRNLLSEVDQEVAKLEKLK